MGLALSGSFGKNLQRDGIGQYGVEEKLDSCRHQAGRRQQAGDRAPVAIL
jgi:hypothetical protein